MLMFISHIPFGRVQCNTSQYSTCILNVSILMKMEMNGRVLMSIDPVDSIYSVHTIHSIHTIHSVHSIV